MATQAASPKIAIGTTITNRSIVSHSGIRPLDCGVMDWSSANRILCRRSPGQYELVHTSLDVLAAVARKDYVDRRRGQDLPISRLSSLRNSSFVINLKKAKALGLSVPAKRAKAEKQEAVVAGSTRADRHRAQYGRVGGNLPLTNKRHC